MPEPKRVDNKAFWGQEVSQDDILSAVAELPKLKERFAAVEKRLEAAENALAHLVQKQGKK